MVNVFKFEKALVPIEFQNAFYCEEYQTETILPYIIRNKSDEIICYLFCEEVNDSLYIQFIEVVDEFKGEGIGTDVVLSLFDQFNVDVLTGNIMIDPNYSAYYFWDSLGSDIDISLDDYIESGCTLDISFILHR